MTDTDLWSRARRVRDQVEQRLRRRTEVRMIDIGRSAAGLPVIQIHVDRPVTLGDLFIGPNIDGIALQILRADDFRLQ